MTMTNIILFGISLLSYFTSLSDATSCTSYSNSTLCNGNNLCEWSEASDACECSSGNYLDVMFIMDSSGSVKSSGWTIEQEFVVEMVETGVDTLSDIAVMNFASGAWAQWNFTDNQDRDAITSHVDAMAFTRGVTQMKTALYAAMTVFDKTGSSDKDDLILLITDGNPIPTKTQLVCDDTTVKDDLDAAGITVIVVGVGDGWDEDQISCLVDDPDSQIIYVTGFSSDAFDAVRDATDTFLCPALVGLTLSEVRVQDHSNDTLSDTSARYVEVYNSGENITLAAQPLILSGIFSGEIQSASGGLILSDQYIIFYDSRRDMPYCYNCPNDTCPDSNGDGLCDNALYISCNGQGDECNFDDASTYDNSNWYVGIQDGSDNSYLVDVDVTENLPWPPIQEGYTFYLEDIYSDNDQYGNNYYMSCFQYGTPGQGPIIDCTGNCVESVCQSLGDTGATCSSGANGACECTDDDGWYKSGALCKQISPPDNCVTNTFREDVIEDGVYWQTIQIVWSSVSDPSLAEVEYFYSYLDPNDQQYYVDSRTPFTIITRYAIYESEMYTSMTQVPQVSTRGETSEGIVVISNRTNCPINTEMPTAQPTMSPTYDIPPVDSCTATIQRNSLNVKVEWTEANSASVMYPPDEIDGYYLFYSANGDAQDTISITNGDLDDTIGLTGYTDPFSDDDLIVSVSAIGYDQNGDIDTSRMETLATNCTLASPAPTYSPSRQPSGLPTETPSGRPSMTPTQQPTYEDWDLSNCIGIISKGGLSIDISWDQNNDPVPDRTIRLDRNGVDGFVTSDRTVTSATLTIGSTFTGIFNAYDTYQLYATQLDSPDGSLETLSSIPCTVTSLAPSLAPSGQPSATPTGVPSGQPSSTPTRGPTNEPTPAPTYEDISVECEFELERQSVAFTVTFTEPDFDVLGVRTPFVGDSRYLIEWTDGTGSSESSQTSANTANSAFSQQVSTNGFDLSQPLTVTVVYDGTTPAGPSIECNATTQNPTESPTTASPTPAPTYSNPEVYIDITSITSDPPCSQLSSGLYECTIDESETVPTNFAVIREPEVFPFDVTFSWEVALEEIGAQNTRRRTLMKGIDSMKNLKKVQNKANNYVKTLKKKSEKQQRSLLQASTEEPSDAFATVDDFLSDTDGESTLSGSTGADENVETVSITLVQEENDSTEEETEEEGREKFYFIILSCSSGGDIYTCNVGVPDRVLLNINNVPGDQLTTKKEKEPLPEWIWYAIGGGVLLLPIVGYFGWRFYNQKKLAEAMEAQRKQDLAEQVALDDAGNFGEIGDAVQFNPLATGGTQDIATGGDYIDAQLQQQKDTFEVAHVDIEQNVFRQDFGPVQTNSRV